MKKRTKRVLLILALALVLLGAVCAVYFGTYSRATPEAAALLQFCGISTSEDKYATTAIPVEITFYDVTGKLIETDTVFVRSDAAITLEESGVTP